MKKFLLLLVLIAGNAAASGADDLRTGRARRAGTDGARSSLQVQIAESDNDGERWKRVLARGAASGERDLDDARPAWDRSLLQCTRGDREAPAAAAADAGTASEAAGAHPGEAAQALGSTPMACRPRQFARTASR
jgi:hypothetical protein